jgi:periplasmic protein CpxP/Spy
MTAISNSLLHTSPAANAPSLTTPVRTRRWVAQTVAVMALAATAAVSLSAWAQPAGSPEAAPAVHHAAMFSTAGGFQGGGPGGWMMGRGLDRMLDSVSATDAQRAQIRQIAEATRNELRAQRDAQAGLRDRAMGAFTQPTVDAREVEAVRQQLLAQHDAVSRRVSQALLDVSRVLTPEQRVQLAQRMKQRHEDMRRRMDDRSRGAPTT